MVDAAGALVVLPLASTDLVGLAQCMALDAEVFPYASIPLGLLAGVRTWVARVDDDSKRLVGFVTASARALSFYVHGIAVAPSDRRRGAGRALLTACVGGARVARLRRVVLHVGTANQTAVALYESEGFEIRRRLRDFYREGVYTERGAYEMVLAVG
jgi:ribosomal protein S18 acetylase RimI-like enzyme